METTIICSSNAPVIKFRSKFQKQFGELPKSTQLRLNSIFSEFITNPDDAYAANILWKLTYNHFSGLSELGIREQDKLLNDDILVLEDSSLVSGIMYSSKRPVEIPSDMIEPLRNELRYQRKKVHPNFLIVNYPSGCKEAFKALLSATGDPILTYEACIHCYQVCYLANDIEINRILYLLGCTKKENIFGGIRSLRFDKYQAEHFLKYARELCGYLEAVWSAISAEKETSANTPLAGKLEVWRETHPEAISEESQEAEEEITKITDANVSVDFPEAADESLKSQLSCLQSTLMIDAYAAERPLSTRNILDDSTTFQNFLNIAGNADFVKNFTEFAQSIKDLKIKGYNCTKALETLPHIEAVLSAKAILEGV